MIKKFIFLSLTVLMIGCDSNGQCYNSEEPGYIFMVYVSLTSTTNENLIDKESFNLNELEVISKDNEFIGDINFNITEQNNIKLISFSIANTNEIAFEYNNVEIGSFSIKNAKLSAIIDCVQTVESFEVYKGSTLICQCNTNDFFVIKTDVI